MPRSGGPDDQRPLRQRPLAVDRALIRFAAFLASLTTVVVVPWTFATAALGRESAPDAFATAGLAVAVTLVMVLVARRLDPLRS